MTREEAIEQLKALQAELVGMGATVWLYNANSFGCPVSIRARWPDGRQADVEPMPDQPGVMWLLSYWPDWGLSECVNVYPGSNAECVEWLAGRA